MTSCSKSASRILEFGYYSLRVSSQRLLEHIAHLEGIIDQNKCAPKCVIPAEIVNAPCDASAR